jgi:general secretion pathway protein G
MLNLTVTNLSARNRNGKRLANRLIAGFTVIELLITLSIFMTVCAIAIPALVDAIKATKIARAVADVRTVGTAAYGYYAQQGNCPNTVQDIGYDQQVDPWGHGYQYLGLNGNNGSHARLDRFGVPINIFFDVYSMGPDGVTSQSLADPVSKDDIVWANDGAYLGLASNY